MSLQEIIYSKIKEEISLDPEGVGYAGKTDEEILFLLNNPVVKDRLVQDFSQSPISRIFSGLAEAPNIVKTEDVVSAKEIKVDK